MRVSAIVSLACWLSIVASMWAGLLNVIVWDKSFWFAMTVWVVIGLLSAIISGRYTSQDREMQ